MKTLASIIMLSALLFACNSQSKNTENPELAEAYTSPVDYNNTIIEAQQAIVEKMLAFGNSFQGIGDETEKIRKEIITACDESIKKVSALEDYEGNTRVRNAAVALFKFYKQITDKEYKELQDILAKGENITEEDLARIEEINMSITERETVLDNELQSAQQEFASKHNFSIQRNSMQNEIDAMSEEY